MKNFIIGFFSLIMIILVGAGISMSSGKSMRANELDSTLGTAMEQCMETLKTKETYKINNEQEFIADFIENMLVKTNSKGTYTVTIYTVDIDKGILDVGVTESYSQLFKTGKVSARKTVVLDEYADRNQIYYTVTFEYNGIAIKKVQVHEGDYLTSETLPESDSYKCWKLGTDKYDRNNISTVRVLSDLTFIGEK